MTYFAILTTDFGTSLFVIFFFFPQSFPFLFLLFPLRSCSTGTHFLKASTITKSVGNINTTVKSNNLFPLNCVYVSEPFKKLYATEITLIIIGCIGIFLILAPICENLMRHKCTFYSYDNGAREKKCTPAFCMLFFVLPYWTQTILWVVVYMPYAYYVGNECNTAPDKTTTGLDYYRMFLECDTENVRGLGRWCSTIQECVKACMAKLPAKQLIGKISKPETYNKCAIFATQSYWILAGKIIGVIGGIVLIIICIILFLWFCDFDHCDCGLQRREEKKMELRRIGY